MRLFKIDSEEILKIHHAYYLQDRMRREAGYRNERKAVS